MSEKKINLIIQMRLGSSRLPNKGMKKINNKSILDILVNRVKNCNNFYKIIIATSYGEKNKPILNYCISNNIDYIQGDEKNVYSRFKKVCEKYNCYYVCRLTGDNPLIDYEYLDKYCEIFKKNNYDLLTAHGTPIGTTSFEFLNMKKLIKNENINDNLENFTQICYNNKSFLTKIEKIRIDHKLTRELDLLIYIRLTIDVMEDFIVVEKIFNNFYGKEYKIKLIDILNYLEKNQHIIEINKECEKYHYYYSLNKLNSI
tara:strand:- start:314 stop:1087 length:774 start_codon:yes stop_codon:yes gene_type:complete